MADEEKGTGYVRQMYVDAIKQTEMILTNISFEGSSAGYDIYNTMCADTWFT